MINNYFKINADHYYPRATSAWCAPLLGWIVLLVASAPGHAQSRDDYCGTAVPAVLEQQAARARSGRYVNAMYGYSVDIPPGTEAFPNPGETERGFSILLSRAPLALLRVDASYDVFYDLTPGGVHLRDLNTIRLHDALLDDQSADAVLALEPARRSRMQLRCSASGELRAHEEIITVRRREIYRIDLATTPERLAIDSRVMDHLVKSWRWEPVRAADR